MKYNCVDLIFTATRASRAARTEAIVVASESDDNGSEDTDSFSDSSEDGDSDSSVEGYAYYGGYGRCYRCGRYQPPGEKGNEILMYYSAR